MDSSARESFSIYEEILEILDTWEFVKESNPEKQTEIANRFASEVLQRIDRIKQEEKAITDGESTRLADNCATCVGYARLAGVGFVGLLSAHYGGRYACWKCSNDANSIYNIAMPDKFSKEVRSKIMPQVRSKHTSLEKQIFKFLRLKSIHFQKK